MRVRMNGSVKESFPAEIRVTLSDLSCRRELPPAGSRGSRVEVLDPFGWA